MSIFNCPHCKTVINTNDKESNYQVNDNDENTYCSYECSAVGTLQYFKSLDEGLSVNEINFIVDNT